MPATENLWKLWEKNSSNCGAFLVQILLVTSIFDRNIWSGAAEYIWTWRNDPYQVVMKFSFFTLKFNKYLNISLNYKVLRNFPTQFLTPSAALIDSIINLVLSKTKFRGRSHTMSISSNHWCLYWDFQGWIWAGFVAISILVHHTIRFCNLSSKNHKSSKLHWCIISAIKPKK